MFSLQQKPVASAHSRAWTRTSRRVDGVTAALPHQASSRRMAVKDERSADDDREATVAQDCGEPAHYEPAMVAYSGRVARAKGGTKSDCGGAGGAALPADNEHSLDKRWTCYPRLEEAFS